MIGKIKKLGNDLFFKAINEHNVHEVIALISDNEVDINCRNINGQTPLHVSHSSLILQAAVKAQNSTIIGILLQHEAQPNI